MSSDALQRLEEQLASLEQRLSRPRAHVTAEGALAAVPAGASDAAQRAMPPYEQPALLSTTAALQPSAVANRLTDRSALAALAPGPAKSTWEGDKTRALLALEDRLSKLQGQNQQNTDDKENKATDTIPARHNTTSTQPPLIITLHAGSGHKAHSHVDTVLHARAGAAPAVLARGAAASAGANAWERGQSQAILALERERDTLAAQLSQYAHLNAIHQRQLMAAHAHHARALEDAQGVAGRKLSHMYEAAGTALLAARLTRQLQRALWGWRQQVARSRRLRWAEHRWNTHTLLHPVLKAWHRVTQEARRPVLPEELRSIQRVVLLSWQLEVQRATRLRCLGTRLATAHLARLTHAWREQALVLRCKRAARCRAEAHRRQRLLGTALCVLGSQRVWAAEALCVLTVKLDRLRARNAFKAWHNLCLFRAHVTLCMQRLRRAQAFTAWHTHAHHWYTIHTRLKALQLTRTTRRMRHYLCTWRATVQWRASLRLKQAQLVALSAAHKQRCVFNRLFRGVQVQRLQRRHSRGVLRTALAAWHGHTRREMRNTRVAAAAAAARLVRLGRDALAAWMVLGAARKARLQEDNLLRLNVMVSELQRERTLAVHDRTLALCQQSAYQSEAAALRAEAQRSMLLGHAGALISTHLHWEALIPTPDITPPAPRSRHCTHWLPGIQPPYRGPSSPGPHTQGLEGSQGVGEGVLDVPWVAQDVLVMYGGVSAEHWLTDVNALVITHTVTGPTLSWQPLSVDTHAMHDGVLRPCVGWASCTAGPTGWVTAGGFNGSEETMDLTLFQVHMHDLPGTTLTDQSSLRDVRDALPYSLSVTAQPVPCRSGRGPPGRTDATIVHHAAGRCLLLFGGYSTHVGGFLADLWVFDMDQQAWWQPEPKGPWPSPRRGHVCTLIGDTVWLYGGYDGTEHLSDLWKCDVKTWTWTQVTQMGAVLSGRRSHACVSLEDRYLLITGGYDGTHHLADVALFDTHTHVWQPVQTTGNVGSAPAAAALHTLTLAGSSCVQLGGTGALGPTASVHLLQSPALQASLSQQQQLTDTLAQLAEARSAVGALQAQADVLVWEKEHAVQQAQVMEDRCASLASQHNQLTQDIDTLQEALREEEAARRLAEDRAHAAEVAAATAKRRLERAREGGRQVAAAAEQLQQDLMEADAQLADQSSELSLLREQYQTLSDLVQQLTGERNALHTLLATANTETQMLRALLARTQQAQEDHAVGTQATAQHRESTGHSHQMHNGTTQGQAQTAKGSKGGVGEGGGAGQAGAHTQGQQTHGEVTTSKANSRGGDKVSTCSVQGNGGQCVENDAQCDVVVVREDSSVLVQQQVDMLQAQLLQERLDGTKARYELRAAEAQCHALQAELDALTQRVAREAAESAAARSLADAALSQLRTHELRHAQEVEHLSKQLRQLQALRWREDVEAPGAAVKAREGEWDALASPRGTRDAIQALRELTPDDVLPPTALNRDNRLVM